MRLEVLRALVDAAGARGGLRSVRDRAALTVGWATACRRSELAALVFADLRRVEEGLEVTIRKSKTDRAGEAPPVTLVPFGSRPATGPVRAIEAWQAALRAPGADVGPGAPCSGP